MTAEDAMDRINLILAHAWMVRNFLKHADEVQEDEEMLDVHRMIFDYSRAVEPSLQRRDASRLGWLLRFDWGGWGAADWTTVRDRHAWRRLADIAVGQRDASVFDADAAHFQRCPVTGGDGARALVVWVATGSDSHSGWVGRDRVSNRRAYPDCV